MLIEPLTLTKIKKKGHKADQDYNIYISLPLPFYSSLVKRLVTLQALCVLIVSPSFFFFPASLLLEELQGESVCEREGRKKEREFTYHSVLSTLRDLNKLACY